MSNMKASFGDKKTKHKSKDKTKMHHWCLCHCWLLLAAIAWNLIALKFHSVLAFKATLSNFIQLTFHFYKCFCKSGHAKESVVKRISKGQLATTNMESVRCLLNIVVVWASSSKDSSLHLGCKNNGIAKNVLFKWWTKKGLAWDYRFCYGYAIPLQVSRWMQISQDDASIAFKLHNFVHVNLLTSMWKTLQYPHFLESICLASYSEHRISTLKIIFCFMVYDILAKWCG